MLDPWLSALLAAAQRGLLPERCTIDIHGAPLILGDTNDVVLRLDPTHYLDPSLGGAERVLRRIYLVTMEGEGEETTTKPPTKKGENSGFKVTLPGRNVLAGVKKLKRRTRT